MGVQGLWKLLESSGRPVALETLNGKVLAVDVSLWLHQALYGVRDKEGQAVTNAHLLVLFNRICKLLFYGIKPVFVFDGATPALKLKTIGSRQQRRQVAKKQSRKLAEKLLRNVLMNQALSEAGGSSDISLPVGDRVREDPFILPPIPEGSQVEFHTSEDPVGSTMSKEDTDTEDAPPLAPAVKGVYENLSTVDVYSDEFSSLPPEIQHELIVEKQLLDKQRKYRHFEDVPEDANNFSDFQLGRLLSRSRLSRRLDVLKKEMVSNNTAYISAGGEGEGEGEGGIKEIETRRIVSKESTHYILMKNTPSQSEGEGDSDSMTSWGRSSEEVGTKRQHKMADSPYLSGTSTPAVIEESIATLEGVATLGSVATSGDVATSVDVSGDMSGDVHLQEAILRSIKSHPGNHDNTPESLPLSNSVASKLRLMSKGILGTDDLEVKGSNCTTEKAEEEGSLNTMEGIGSVCALSETVDLLAGNSSTNEVLKFVSEPVVVDRDDEGGEDGEGDVCKVGGGAGEVCIVGGGEGEDDMCQVGDGEGDMCRLGGDENGEDVKVGSSSVQVDLTKQEPHDQSPHPQPHLQTSSSLQNEEEVAYMSSSGTSDDDISDRKLDGGFPSTVPSMSSEMVSSKSVLSGEIVVDTTAVAGSNEGDKEKMATSGEVPSTSTVPAPLSILLPTDENDKRRDQFIRDAEQLPSDLLQSQLEKERRELQKEEGQQSRYASEMSSQIYKEAQELLTLFKLPYMVSPAEAEAQCAWLDTHHRQVDGTITDDNDYLLFGGWRLYRYFFSQNHIAEMYTTGDIQQCLGLSQEQLVLVAMLTGSDYTDGVDGIGVVTAMEILRDFSGEGIELLRNFKGWHTANRLSHLMEKSTKHKRLLQLSLSSSFPDEQVFRAYVNPSVDESIESFEWGIPDGFELKQFAMSKFGWSEKKSSDTVGPVMRRMNEMKNPQTKITQFMNLPQIVPEKRKIKSKRVRRAVARIQSGVTETKTVSDTINLSDSSSDEENGARQGCDQQSKKKTPSSPHTGVGGSGNSPTAGGVHISPVPSGYGVDSPGGERRVTRKRGPKPKKQLQVKRANRRP